MTSTTVPNIETMSASFPEEVLPIQDKPDFTSVRDLRDQIYANAASVDTMAIWVLSCLLLTTIRSHREIHL
jgi:hypothetical protein